LKKSGISFKEQSIMTAEERRWWFKQIEEEKDAIERRIKGSRQL